VWDVIRKQQSGFTHRNPRKDDCSSGLTRPGNAPLVLAFSNPARVVIQWQWRHIIKVPPLLLQTTKININKFKKRKQRRKVHMRQKQTYSWRRIRSSKLIDLMWNNTNVLQNIAEVHQNLLLCQLLCRDHQGGILGTNILETVVFPRLQGLNLATKVVGNDTKPGHALLL
jgi:hypothetical protein